MLIKKYFHRPQDPKGIKFQEYDYRALALLDDYRFLDSEMLFRLLKLYHPQLTWDTAKHRFHALWRNGFIERPPEQLSILVKQDKFHLVMCLTKKGAELVAQHYGRDFQKTTWRVDQERANFRMLEHQLAISRFRATLELSQQFQIPFWLHDRQFQKSLSFTIQTELQRKALDADHIGQRVTKTIVPDSFFALSHQNNSPAYIALEIDMGTAGTKAMASKYLSYYNFLKAIEQQPLSVLGHCISRLWILTVSPDERHFERPGLRVAHLKEAVRAMAESDHGPALGYRAFIFSTQDQLSWQEPESILRPIWQTPNQNENLSLLSLPQYHDQPMVAQKT